MIDLIGVPFDLCGPVLGSRLGPTALRLNGMVDQLTDLGLKVHDSGNVWDIDASVPPSYSSKLKEAVLLYSKLADQVEKSCKKGHTPLVMGGDHSLSIGSVSGALRHYKDDLGVLWIDAHADLNTPGTSPSGNFHGMPLAACLRMKPGERASGEKEVAWDRWKQILEDIVPPYGLGEENLAWIGLRDVDKGEVSNLNKLPNHLALTMQDIDHDGLTGCVEQIDSWINRRSIKHLWVSFDVDSLDPMLAPGTGTRVRGGLTYREGHLLAELLHLILSDESRDVSLAGLDVVEVNPLSDQAGQTANMAIEWTASFFGKRIMGKRL